MRAGPGRYPIFHGRGSPGKPGESWPYPDKWFGEPGHPPRRAGAAPGAAAQRGPGEGPATARRRPGDGSEVACHLYD
ncbi:hypothetical protein [Nonomuraea sp. GTA35]|uniref:hypothetical protein n=1 Tax=Nonomuraea sp. GTA35 TaxID=1676746 RepID=UPI0035BEB84F